MGRILMIDLAGHAHTAVLPDGHSFKALIGESEICLSDYWENK